MQERELRATRFSVIGGARSGLAVASLLRSRGAEVFVSEQAAAERSAELRSVLDRLGVACEFGGHTARATEADVIVVSPGVSSDAPIVREALSRGCSVVSELEVASWFWRGPIVAITGTNGKTTTTALTGRMLSDARIPSVVAGNIGRAFSAVAEQTRGDEVAVLEVSSFQLDHVRTFRPAVAVLLNITPDHLDRYGHSFERYIASKMRIIERQKEGDALIYNADDEVTRQAVERSVPAGVRLLPFGLSRRPAEGAFEEDGMLKLSMAEGTTDVLAVEAISIPGIHNRYNAMAATLAARLCGAGVASLRSTLVNFKGVEHRLEFVRDRAGVKFVNDSKATNVDSVWYALQSFASPIVLLLGGRDKGNDYSRLEHLVRTRVKAVVAIGESAATVQSFFGSIVPTTTASSMAEAVRIAAGSAVGGDIVLLSPACASFDWFENYEHRGRVFKELVMNL